MTNATKLSPEEILEMEKEEIEREKDKTFGTRLFMAYVLLYGIFFIYTFLSPNTPQELFWGLTWRPFPILLTVMVFISWFSFGIMDQKEIGVHSMIGRIYKGITPGLFLKIPLISKIIKMPSTITDSLYCDIEATTGAEMKVDGDPLNNRMTLYFDTLSRYIIVDPIACYRTIDDTKKSIMEEIADQMASAIKSTLIIQVGKHTPAEIIKGKIAEINEELKRVVEELVGKMGVKVLTARIEKIKLWAGVSEALASVAREQSTGQGIKDKTILVAEGEKYRKTAEGEGDANAVFVRKEAEAKGNELLAQVAKTSEGKITLAMDVAKALNATATKVVVLGNQGVAGLVTQGKAILEAMEEKTN